MYKEQEIAQVAQESMRKVARRHIITKQSATRSPKPLRGMTGLDEGYAHTAPRYLKLRGRNVDPTQTNISKVWSF